MDVKRELQHYREVLKRNEAEIKELQQQNAHIKSHVKWLEKQVKVDTSSVVQNRDDVTENRDDVTENL